MRSLIIGVSLLALTAPTAYAQQAPKPAVPPPGAPMAATVDTAAAMVDTTALRDTAAATAGRRAGLLPIQSTSGMPVR